MNTLKMPVTLTSDEAVTILGILEDLVGEDDFVSCYSLETRMTVYGLIRKLGGTYFGKEGGIT